MTTLFNTVSANKPITYGVQDFLFRFRKLQLLCKSLGIDGILIICGFDSHNNEEYDKLTSWLFNGYSGSTVEKEVYLDPKFKEFIFLVQKNGASCFLEPELFDLIQRYLVAIPNINIYCPTLKQMENTDDVELHKISQFYKMTRNLGSVGVALGARDDGKIRNIEKWPLLQAYGLEEVGCGFFGMNHQAKNITDELHQLYEEYDRYLISTLINTSAKQMEHHINSTFYIIDSTEIKKRPKITEQELNSIIHETFEFSIIKQPSIGNFPDLPQSRILFGKNTNKTYIEWPTTQTFAECSASQEKTPLHFTLEYVDPLTRMRVARTYFATLNEPSHLIMKENKDEEDRLLSYSAQRKENPHYNDEKLLVGYYAIIIRTFHTLLEHFTANIQDLSQEFVEKKFFEEFCTPEGLNLSLDQLIVQLKCYNSYGIETKTNVYQTSADFINQNICILRVQIKNIKSYANEEVLGSILFCDTFYMQPGAFYNVTKNIPYFKAWTIDPTSSESIEKIKDVIICEEFGKPTSSTFDSVHLHIPSTEIFQRSNLEHVPQKVELTVHENGFKLKSELWGTLAIFFKDLERVELLRKVNRPVAILHLKEKQILSSISTNQYHLFFSGFAATDVFLKLNTILEGKVPYKAIEDVPGEIASSVSLYFSGLLSDKYFKISRIHGSQILETHTFIKFLEYQEALKINNNKDLNFKIFYKLTEGAESSKQDQSPKVEVFFVNGAYSAGKTKFAQNLAINGKNLGYKVHIYKKELRDLPNLNNKIFVEGLKAFVSSVGAQPGEKIIAVLPSILNTKLIIDNILRMTDFTDNFDIKAVITKINMNNFYHNAHKEISENFLTFCNAGYSQFIILDNYGTDDSEVDALNSALRGLFPYSTVFRINSNIVQQSITKDILTSNNFNAKINKIERKKNIPFKPLEKKYVYIPFKVPLMREKVYGYLYQHIFQDNNGYLLIEDEASEVEQPKTKKREKVEDELALLKARIKRVNMELSKEIPYIYCVQGLTRFDDSLDQVHKLNVNSNYVFEKALPGVKGTVVKEDVKGLEKTTVVYENFRSDDLGLLFYGENLDEAKLREMLKNVIKPLKTKMKIKTREDLTEEQIRELELEYRSWGLEDGVFFDGSRFRDWEGNILPHHPKLEEIIQDYLAKENDTVGSVNRQIDKEWKTLEQLWD